ncbi:hypothetical protein LINPERHAP2_LOCUS18406 [Linum perenne]
MGESRGGSFSSFYSVFCKPLWMELNVGWILVWGSVSVLALLYGSIP